MATLLPDRERILLGPGPSRTSPRVMRAMCAPTVGHLVPIMLKLLDDVRSRYGLNMLDPPVPKSVRFAEAPAQGRSILRHASSSAGAAAYRAIAGTLHGDLTSTDVPT